MIAKDDLVKLGEYLSQVRLDVGVRIYLLFLLYFIELALQGFTITLAVPVLYALVNSESTIIESNVINQALLTIKAIIPVTLNLFTVMWILLITYTAKSVVLLVNSIYARKILLDCSRKMRSNFLHQLAHSEISSLRLAPVGHITNFLAVEIERYVFSIKTFFNLFISFGYCVLYVSYAYWANTLGALFVTVAGLILVLALMGFNKVTKRLSVELTDRRGSFQQKAIELIENIGYLKGTGTDSLIISRIDSDLLKMFVVNMRLSVMSSVRNHAFLPLCVVILFILVATKETAGNGIDEMFMLFLMVVGLLITTFIAMQGNVGKLFEAWGSVGTIKYYRNMLPGKGNGGLIKETEVEEDSGSLLPIVLKGVVVRYDSDGDSMTIPEMIVRETGTVGIVGVSGSGKTTLIRVLLGLVKGASGEVHYGERPVTSLTPERRFSSIGYVSQEDVLFSGTIMENISLYGEGPGDSQLVREKVINAAKSAELDRAVMTFPKKYDTEVGQDGFELSGGEKRRLCLARELYKSPKLLILDEVFAGLDESTADKLWRMIRKLGEDMSILLVTHDSGKITGMDRIYTVLDGVVRQGWQKTN